MSSKREDLATGGAAACGCCAGVTERTPVPTANRPGLDALRYRVGTHGAFFETLTARLSRLFLEKPDGGGEEAKKIYPLQGLRTRSTDDPSIALLDVWAVLADVLTFYQERIANEGYLRTALERLSLLELGRLVGYAPRPGVAASVYLAFTVDDNYEEVVVPAGTRAQSVPEGEGELPQFFETRGPLTARSAWNVLVPRLERPQDFQVLNAGESAVVYLDGTSTQLKANDPICVPEHFTLYRATSVVADSEAGRTAVTLERWRQPLPTSGLAVVASVAPEAPPAVPDVPSAEEVADAVTPLLDLEARGIHRGATAKRVVATVEGPWRQGGEPEDLVLRLEDVLEKLGDEHLRARESGWWKLEEWIGELQSVLTRHRDHLAEAGRREVAAPSAEPAAAVVVADHQESQVSGTAVLSGVLGGLSKVPSAAPANAQRLARSIDGVFSSSSQMGLEVLSAFQPRIRQTLYGAWANAVVSEPPVVESVEALRIRAAPFGAAAPLQPVFDLATDDEDVVLVTGVAEYRDWGLQAPHDRSTILTLDAQYDQILPGTCVVVDRENRDLLSRRVTAVRTVSVAAFGITGTVTELTLDGPWLFGDELSGDASLSVVRGTVVYAQGENLGLSARPIDPEAEPVAGDEIELDGLYPGLEPGRWLIVHGERTDVPGTTGVPASELAMIAEVRQGVDDNVRGDTNHTFLKLATEKLAYTYKRDTVVLYANVVEATHGETRDQVLTSGDGSRAGQSVALAFKPLTHVAAATPDGAESTLAVRVHDVLWHEADNPLELGPDDRRYLTATDDEETTTVLFGDGVRGARLPTGVENVTAVYRQGIGKAGNVRAAQISLLSTQPLGVQGVTNPLPASGGADRDGPSTMRRNAPLQVMALDRLVSVRDYADFARTFAGIARADAQWLSDGDRRLVHLTVAGVEDAPIAADSALLRNLRAALGLFGDPHQPFAVEVREHLLLVISARVRIDADYRFEAVESAVRTALVEALGFERRELGQDVTLSEVMAAVHAVRGVVAADIDALDGVDEKISPEELEKIAEDLVLRQRVVAETARVREHHPVRRQGETLASVAGRYGTSVEVLVELNPDLVAGSDEANGVKLKVGDVLKIPRTVLPAQIAYLSGDLPDTLILTEWTR